MAKPSFELISAIRSAARKLSESNQYQWGHMGSCNCGFLAQEISQLRKDEIHRRSMTGHGDWTEQLNDYCPTSGLPMDDLISELLRAGLSTDDLKHLERLSDPTVLHTLTTSRRLRHNCQQDAVTYMTAWANALESRLINCIQLPAFDTEVPA